MAAVFYVLESFGWVRYLASLCICHRFTREPSRAHNRFLYLSLVTIGHDLLKIITSDSRDN